MSHFDFLKHDSSISSFIGSTTTFHGDLISDNTIRIDGKYKGRIISSSMVYIGKLSLSECTIYARDAIIGGTLKGNIYTENSLKILKTAEIIGNIYATTVHMEDGVVFDGECKILSKEEMKNLIEKNKLIDNNK